MIIEKGTYDDFKLNVLYGWLETFCCLADELAKHCNGKLVDAYYADELMPGMEGMESTILIEVPTTFTKATAYMRLESYGFRKPVPMNVAVTVVIPGYGEVDCWLEKSTPRMGRYFRYAKKLEQLKLNRQGKKRSSKKSCG